MSWFTTWLWALRGTTMLLALLAVYGYFRGVGEFTTRNVLSALALAASMWLVEG